MPNNVPSVSQNLLDLVRVGVSKEQIRAILVPRTSPRSWSPLLDEADTQGVTPLVYQALKPYHQEIAPEIWFRISKAHFDIAAMNALFLEEWASVVQCLTEQNIETLVIKGAALAGALYGNVALRPMQDLDLLVHQAQVPEARMALRSRGYLAVKEEHFSGAAEAFESQVSLARRDDATTMNYVCELHWHLLDSPFYQRTMPLDWFWETAVPLQLEQATTKTLGPEARLLHLCTHLALHHHGERLLWYCDIDRLIRHSGRLLDWDEVIARAQMYRLVLSLRTILVQTIDWLDTPVPEGVRGRLAAMQPGSEEAALFDFMVAPPHGVVERFLNDLSQLSGTQQRLRFILANIFPAPAYMRQRYQIEHTWQLLPYYFYRLIRGVLNGVRVLTGG
ncbi:MAG: nucleotidyltransferase family protein [Chloroflexi bacterium]|nr:nucleotidyltransferase family protein [Chloroflexota bacterium]